MMDHSVSVKQGIETHTICNLEAQSEALQAFSPASKTYYDRPHEVRIGNEEARREITGAIPDQAVKLDIA